MALAGVCVGVSAQPYRPDRDAEVLADLPARTAPAPLPRARDAGLATRAARLFIERGRRSGDPRDFGYAEGLLQPWWTDPDAPDAVLLLRATLRQHRHEFDAALADLDRLIGRSPLDAQALLTRATLHRVQGALDRSLEDCRAVQRAAPGFAASLCQLAVTSQRDPAAALIAMAELEPASISQADALVAWYRAEQGAAAERLGERQSAETAYQAGLARAPWDVGLRAALADLLLAQARTRDALALLDGAATADALRLRRLLALRELDAQAAAALADAVAASFAAARQRGDIPHLREEALFELRWHANAPRALELAQANWRDQRELADTRLLLEAAQAAGDAQVVAELRAWCGQRGIRDVWLEARW